MEIDPAAVSGSSRKVIEIIEVHEITYSVPQILAILAIFSTGSLMIAIFTQYPVQAVALTIGFLACIVAVLLCGFTVFVKPELLQSERREHTTRPSDPVTKSGIGS